MEKNSSELKIGNKKLFSGSVGNVNNHKAVKIAVLGSYGKTSMKELLSTVLSEKLEIAS